ncbi:vitamin D3 receptor B-like [Ptychodera flava]|uniref:vitamin D3 receptor B-like n=1 Tax=Ptychodera flava TaxID=63121 RepID=UPI003969DF47
MASLQSSNKGLCLVCGDYANGVHYNVLSCEGCKSFFLRSVKSKATFTCSENKNCEMDLYTRRHCPACRMKKCVDLGMNPEKVWDDMRLKKRKPLVRTKKKKMSHVIEPPVTPPSEASSCSESIADTPAELELKPDQQSLSQLLETSFIQSKQVYKELAPQLSPPLQQTMEKFTIGGMSPRKMADTVTQALMNGKDTEKPRGTKRSASSSKQGKQKRSKRQQEQQQQQQEQQQQQQQEQQQEKQESEESKDKVNVANSFALSFLLGQGSSQPKLEICKDLVMHAMDLFAVTVKQIIFFAKSIPGFSQLTCDDQAALIRAAIMETIIIRCTERFDTNKNLLVSDINEGEYGLNLIFQLGYKTFTEPFFKFMREMKFLNLHMEEYALLQAAIILQSDRPDLKNADLVEKLQFPLILTLQACTKKNHPEDPALFAKLMLKMVTLRDIDHVHSKDLMDMKLQEHEFTPLVQELFGL